MRFFWAGFWYDPTSDKPRGLLSLAAGINVTVVCVIQIFWFYPTSQSTPQAIFRRPSRRLKQSSDILVYAPKVFPTSQLTLREMLPLAGTAGREDCPLDTLERSSVDPVGAADGSSDVSVDAPKKSLTSQSTPQAIFRRPSWQPQGIFRRPSRRWKKSDSGRYFEHQ